MCDFVRLVKGVNFIKEVQEKTKNFQKLDNPSIPISTEEAMATEPVKLALEMGIDYNTLRNKTQKNILATGRPYATIEDLLKSIFDKEENSSGEQSTSIISNENVTPIPVYAKNIDVEKSENTAVVFKSKQSDKNDRLLLEEENRKLKDARLCKVCLDEEVGVVYLPCGHLGLYSNKSCNIVITSLVYFFYKTTLSYSYMCSVCS